MKKGFVLGLILIGVVFIIACGRKAPPRLPAYEQPPAPTALSAIHREDTIILNWDYPRNKLRYVREFRVMRSEHLLASTEETTYTEHKILPEKIYDYTVFAVSTSGIVSDATAQVIVETADVPAAPEGLAAEVAKEGVVLRWSHERSDVTFNVYRSPERDFNPLLPANPEPLSGTSFTDIPYADKTVYYSVRALLGGPVRHEGLPSMVVEIKPEAFVPSSPDDLRIALAGNKVLLAWKENPEVWVNSYKIYRALDGQEFYLIGESRTPSFIDSDGLKGSLSYKVRAMGPAVEGAFSGAAMVETE